MAAAKTRAEKKEAAAAKKKKAAAARKKKEEAAAVKREEAVAVRAPARQRNCEAAVPIAACYPRRAGHKRNHSRAARPCSI